MDSPLIVVKGPVTVSVENSDGSALDIGLLFATLRGKGLNVHGYMIGDALRPAVKAVERPVPHDAVVELLRHAAGFGSGGYARERKCCGAPPGAEHPPACFVRRFCDRYGIDLGEVEGG